MTAFRRNDSVRTLGRNDSGYVLFATLIFLFIFSLLTVSSLSNLQLNLKIKQAALQRAESVFISRQLLSQLTVNHQCTIPLTLPKSLTQQSLLWWWQHGCRLSSQYFYVIEFLSSDPCAIIENTQATAAYYRFTFYTPSQNDQGNPVVLQSTVIEPTSITKACSGKSHTVQPGQQMWREL